MNWFSGNSKAQSALVVTPGVLLREGFINRFVFEEMDGCLTSLRL